MSKWRRCCKIGFSISTYCLSKCHSYELPQKELQHLVLGKRNLGKHSSWLEMPNSDTIILFILILCRKRDLKHDLFQPLKINVSFLGHNCFWVHSIAGLGWREGERDALPSPVPTHGLIACVALQKEHCGWLPMAGTGFPKWERANFLHHLWPADESGQGTCFSRSYFQ